VIDVVISIALGIGLAAAAGMRLFMPLAAVSLAAYLDYLPVNENFAWLGSGTAVIILCTAMVLEVLAYYIPFFDNLLDAIAVPLAAAGGTILMASTMLEMEPIWKWTIAVIAGGGTAGLIKGKTAVVRGASSTFTAGLGNSVVSSVENIFVVVLVLLILFVPIAALFLIAWIVYRIFKILFALFTSTSKS
jgi:hypothetical protein